WSRCSMPTAWSRPTSPCTAWWRRAPAWERARCSARWSPIPRPLIARAAVCTSARAGAASIWIRCRCSGRVARACCCPGRGPGATMRLRRQQGPLGRWARPWPGPRPRPGLGARRRPGREPRRRAPGRLSRARVGLVDGAPQALRTDVRVDLRGGQRRVAEEVLDAAQVRAAFDEVGRGAVTEGVRGDVAGDPGLPRVAVHEGPHGPIAETASAHSEEQRLSGAGGLAAVLPQHGAALGLPPLHGLQRRDADGDDPLPVALAADPDRAVAVVDPRTVQGDQLGDAQTGG